MKVTYQKGRRKDPSKIADDVRNLVKEYAERVQKIYSEDVVGTWEHQPDFPVTDVSSGGNLTLNVGPSGDEKAVHIFRYVDEGTRIRYARMTIGFRPKSAPGNLLSGAGVGGFEELDFVPRPGIQPREFGKEIVKQLTDDFVADVRRAIEG